MDEDITAGDTYEADNFPDDCELCGEPLPDGVDGKIQYEIWIIEDGRYFTCPAGSGCSRSCEACDTEEPDESGHTSRMGGEVLAWHCSSCADKDARRIG